MLDTYIKNRGTTKTIIHNNNRNQVEKIDWDADYDGKEANIKIDLNENGHNKHIHFSLDNNDLASILNIPTIDFPLEKRLKRDFYKHTNEPIIYRIELDKEQPEESEKPEEVKSILETIGNSSIDDIHISSPLPNEDLIIPLSINENGMNLTPKRRRRRYRTHKIYPVYRRKKNSYLSNSRSKRRSNSSFRRSSSRRR
jgi:hypothetical protein